MQTIISRVVMLLSMTTLGVLSATMPSFAQSNIDVARSAIHNLAKDTSSESVYRVLPIYDGGVALSINSGGFLPSRGKYAPGEAFARLNRDLSVHSAHIRHELLVNRWVLSIVPVDSGRTGFWGLGVRNDYTVPQSEKQPQREVWIQYSPTGEELNEIILDDTRDYVEHNPSLGIPDGAGGFYGVVTYGMNSKWNISQAEPRDSIFGNIIVLRHVDRDGNIHFECEWPRRRRIVNSKDITTVGDSLVCISYTERVIRPPGGNNYRYDSARVACVHTSDGSLAFETQPMSGTIEYTFGIPESGLTVVGSGTHMVLATHSDSVRFDGMIDDLTINWAHPHYYGISLTGDILWHHFSPSADILTNINDVASFSSGGFLAFGTANLARTPGDWRSDRDRYAIVERRAAADAALIWRRYFSYSTNDKYDYFFPYDGYQDVDGTIIVGGKVDDEQSTIPQDGGLVWVMRLDSSGCPYKNCYRDSIIWLDRAPGSVGIGEQGGVRADLFSVSPNPAQQGSPWKVQLRKGVDGLGASFSLLDATGREVSRGWLEPGQESISVSNDDLPAGSYSILMWRDGSIISAKTLLLQ